MCTITINGIQGHESTQGQGIDRITISGNATQCAAVSVDVHQTQPVDVHLPTRQTNVDAQGNWSVDFSIALGDFSAGTFVCGRGNKYVIDAACVTDPQCNAQYADSRIPCGGCPVVTVAFRGIRPRDLCDANGQRPISITMNVMLGSSDPATITMELQVASAAPGAAVIGPTSSVTASNTIIPATGPWIVSLSPGDYIVRARFADAACPPQEFSLTVPVCPPVLCPDIDWSADISPQCDANGRRAVTVSATILFPGTSISASLLNAQGQVIDSGTQTGDLTVVSPALSLGGGDHDFSVQLNTAVPDSCRPDLEHTVSVPNCPGGGTCPTVVWNPALSANCNPDNTRDVTVSATVSSFGAPITAELRDPQGTALDTATTPANGTATMDSGALSLTPGNHQFTVAFTTGLPGGCAADDTNVVTVPPCRGGGGGRESLGCTILRILALALLIPGLVAIVGGACSVNAIAIGAGVAAALIGAALLVTWALLCAPAAGCLALQRVIGLVNLLITVVAVIAAIFAVLGLFGIVVGWPCLLGALADGVILSVLQLALMQIFLAQGCQWQGRSIYG